MKLDSRVMSMEMSSFLYLRPFQVKTLIFAFRAIEGRLETRLTECRLNDLIGYWKFKSACPSDSDISNQLVVSNGK